MQELYIYMNTGKEIHKIISYPYNILLLQYEYFYPVHYDYNNVKQYIPLVAGLL